MKWQEAEIDFLKDNFGKIKAIEIAEMNMGSVTV